MTSLKKCGEKIQKNSGKYNHSEIQAAPPARQNHYYHPYRKLYRSRSEKWLGGVCGGLAKYFNSDPVLIRLIWVAVTILSLGTGIIAYILFWLFVQNEPSGYTLTKEYVTRDDDGREHRHYHYKVTE